MTAMLPHDHLRIRDSALFVDQQMAIHRGADGLIRDIHRRPEPSDRHSWHRDVREMIRQRFP